MDIEQLTKVQIVLLVLLVSFVTSMATGIVTVSLMDQSPEGVTYTINRIIEQSAEAVTGMVVEDTEQTQDTSTVSSVKTVADVVAEVAPSVVSLYGVSEEGEAYIGTGTIVFDGATVATTASGIVAGSSYTARLSNGTHVEAIARVADAVSGISVLSLSFVEGMAQPSPVRIATKEQLRLGQALMILGGEGVELATGLLTALPEEEMFSTNILAGKRFSGGPAITSSGACAGLVHVSEGVVSIVPFGTVTALMTAPEGE